MPTLKLRRKTGTDVPGTLAHGQLGFTQNRLYYGNQAGTAVRLAQHSELTGDTTYSAGSGISLSGTTFSVAGGTGLTQDTSGLSLTSITAGNSTVGAVRYNGTTSTAGQFNGGSTVPTGTTRLNYQGRLYVGQLSIHSTTNTTGTFNIGTTSLTGTSRMNWNGHFHATKFVGPLNETRANNPRFIWTGTQAQYDGIGTKNTSTLYFIT